MRVSKSSGGGKSRARPDSPENVCSCSFPGPTFAPSIAPLNLPLPPKVENDEFDVILTPRAERSENPPT